MTTKSWVEELRSGRHKQTHGKLKNRAGAHCCLGVLEEDVLGLVYKYEAPTDYTLSGKGRYTNEDGDSGEVCQRTKDIAVELDHTLTDADRYKIKKVVPQFKDSLLNSRSSPQGVLIELNDNYGYNFQQIADVVEKMGWNVEYETA